MIFVQQLAILLIQLYTLILIVRVVFESIGMLSRAFRPPRWICLIAEPFFVVTDPPINALRRVIPPLQMGPMALDMAVLVLFFILLLLQYLIHLW